MQARLQYRMVVAAISVGCLLAATSMMTPTKAEALSWPSLSLIDTAEIPAGGTALGLPFGGISGIDYDRKTDSYLAISDDRSERASARTYRLALPFDQNGFIGKIPTVVSTSTLQTAEGDPFAYRHVDPEAARLAKEGGYWWSSEGSPATGEPPFIRYADPTGLFVREIQLPAAYLPTSSGGTPVAGIRPNLGFEGLTISANHKELTTITENALVQDGPAAAPTTGSSSRLAEFDLRTGLAKAEYVYSVDQVPFTPTVSDGYADRGVSDLLRLSNKQYLVLERSFESGHGYQVQIFLASTSGAANVVGKSALDGTEVAMTKQLLFDFNAQNVYVDNLEGMSFGPDFADGSRSLLVMSDDNFGNSDGRTQVQLLRVSGLE